MTREQESHVAFVILAVVLAGCLPVEGGSPSAGASVTVASASGAVASTESTHPRRPLPDGFPVLPGAVPIAMPANDPGLIGLWESDELGSAAYDFYVAALPAAGYPIVGLYAGGDVALIRFGSPDGGVWQMVAHGTRDGRVAIEIRLDRP